MRGTTGTTTVNTAPLRVLGRLRLSRSTDESTSIERQREIVQQWADANGHTVVAWAEDLDVSGSVDPFDTPELGTWLAARAGEWDILAAWKLDRLGRNAIQLSRLFGWCQEHGKTLVSCSESIDLGSWAGRMLASVIAGLAEGELEAIRERQRSSRAKLRESARWPGGKAPYGYRAVPHPESAGWTLVVDKPAAAIVRRIVSGVIDGNPISRIAEELTREGAYTPARYYAALRASEVPITAHSPQGGASSDGTRWQTTAIRNMLRSRALLGYAHHRGETVRDDDGNPVQMAEPLISTDDWELLQSALDRVRDSHRSRPAEAGPLSGVVVCHLCDGPLHHDVNRVKRGKGEYRYYKCPRGCGKKIPADILLELAEEAFLYDFGQTEVRERVWVSGDSREKELRETITSLDELSAAAGRAQSATAKQRLQRQLDALDAKLVELESAPRREARWEYVPTGQTYGAVWAAADPGGKRDLLVKSGITIAAAITGVEGKRSGSNAGALHVEIRSPAPFDEAKAAAAAEERRKWGVPRD